MTAVSKPILAVTLGDPAGTGPELITRAFADAEVRAVCRPVAIGDAGTLRAALAITQVAATVRVVDRPAVAADDTAVIGVVDLANVDRATLERGTVSGAAGRAA